jgi:hypothetical protein
MKYLYLVLTVIVLSGCSPKYVVKKSYDASSANRGCVNQCEAKEKSCRKACTKDKNKCMKEAEQRAHAMMPSLERSYRDALYAYNIQMDTYAAELRSWSRSKRHYQQKYDYYHKHCKKKESRECKERDRFKSKLHDIHYDKPREPDTVEKPDIRNVIKDEQQACAGDCACEDIYDRCFSKCGGKINFHKFCIANCKEDR